MLSTDEALGWVMEAFATWDICLASDLHDLREKHYECGNFPPRHQVPALITSAPIGSPENWKQFFEIDAASTYHD